MKSYRVKATGDAGRPSGSGENRALPEDKTFRVEVTVEGNDEAEARSKAVIYLNRIYDSCRWRADSAELVSGPSSRTGGKLGARRPLPSPRRRR